MTVESKNEFLQRYNILIGIIICTFFTSIFTLVLQTGFFFMGDIFLVISCGIGLYVTFENRSESQSHLKTGLIVGLGGSVLSIILISLLFSIVYRIDFIFLLVLFLIQNGIIFVIVGVIMGYLFANSYRKKDSPEALYPRN
ncbi:MAG: hypothetical protein ACXABG_13145 [Promethearchaeota archaeon]